MYSKIQTSNTEKKKVPIPLKVWGTKFEDVRFNLSLVSII